MYLARHQTPDFARHVLREGFPGVRGEREYRRYYPAGEVTAQVLGLTNVDGRGIAGVELAYRRVAARECRARSGLSRISTVRRSETFGVVELSPARATPWLSVSTCACNTPSTVSFKASDARDRRGRRFRGDPRCLDWRGARGQ